MFDQMPPDEGDDLEEKKALLAELMQFAQGGMASDAASRLGKSAPIQMPPMPIEGSPGEAPLEAGDGAGGDDPMPPASDIPGIEPEIEQPEGAPGSVNMDGIRSALAKMKAGRGG